MPVKRWMFEAAAIAVAATMLGFMLWRLAGAHDMSLPSGQPLFGDFIAFWSAGRAALDGHAAEVHDRALIFSYHTMVAPDVRFVAPWNSPPTFLLVACGLALMPYGVSAIVFLVATLAFFLLVMRSLLPDARALIFAASAPAVVYHAGTVQAALLVSGVTGLALAMLDKRPRLAGLLVALLAIKPHLALLWPLFLLLSRRWVAFVAAALGTVAFVVLAGLVFGFETYISFAENLAASQRLISSQQITTPAYASVFANLLDLGAPTAVAGAAHAASAVLALAVSSWLFWRGDRAVAGAALCAATLLMSPYMFFYDYTLLLMAAAVLGAPRSPYELAAYVFAWGAGLTVAVGYYLPLPICPLAAWLMLGVCVTRARSAALRPAPAQPT
ncbi:MAG: glycosyltransferase family 87 protein [Hyphomonadaceae bacterium]